MITESLRRPFPPEHIQWRPGRPNADRTQCRVLAYVDTRLYMARLDQVCGIDGWQVEYRGMPQGIICSLSIYIDDEWIKKEDAAEVAASGEHRIKVAATDAFRRASAQWGIGRYLYVLPDQWVDCEPRGEYGVRLTGEPTLPDWAIPKEKE